MDFEKIRTFLNEEDKFCKYCGIELTVVGDGYAEAVLHVNEDKLNGRGVVQGGAIMTLADFAYAGAVNVSGVTGVSVTAMLDAPSDIQDLPTRLRNSGS